MEVYKFDGVCKIRIGIFYIGFRFPSNCNYIFNIFVIYIFTCKKAAQEVQRNISTIVLKSV